MAVYLALTCQGVQEAELAELLERIAVHGAAAEVRRAGRRLLVVVSGGPTPVLEAELARCDRIATVLDGSAAHPLAGRAAGPEGSVVDVGGVRFGAGRPVVIAGPCSAERPEVLFETAAAVGRSGAAMLRVGVFKPRTSPYSFQGLGRAGLDMLRAVRAEFDLPVVTEVMSVRDIDMVAECADMLQVGARNMQNFPLLIELGRAGRPVLLKRGLSATVADWLSAAEYLLSHGSTDVVLCERGIRTFEHATRFTLDLNAVPVAKELSHLPVIVDPSHGTGAARYVAPMSAAGLAAGADGVMVEVHPRPEEALSDGPQSLDFAMFDDLVTRLHRIADALGTELATPDRKVHT
jgi:3-deoxy-7-phosphoheptulonate synthase